MSDPISVVERQLDAYNAHDLEGFCACFSRDVVVMNADGERTIEGIDAFREAYRDEIEGGRTRGEVLSRTASGSWVADAEVLTGLTDDPIRALVVFRVGADGLIDRVVIGR